MNGFVGEFTIVLGIFRVEPIYAAFAATGLILGAWYMLTLIRHVMHGPLENPANKELQDLSSREVLIMVPIALLIFAIGIFPSLLFERIEPSVRVLLGQMLPAMTTLR